MNIMPNRLGIFQNLHSLATKKFMLKIKGLDIINHNFKLGKKFIFATLPPTT